ncbi:hypothetical protein BYT27DRAFT_7248653 [Phlegmacium glaucopus]|nr:hypothetical protein BYT27DRAFT_7248653 [Phlegmacium glaucopus]
MTEEPLESFSNLNSTSAYHTTPTNNDLPPPSHPILLRSFPVQASGIVAAGSFVIKVGLRAKWGGSKLRARPRSVTSYNTPLLTGFPSPGIPSPYINSATSAPSTSNPGTPGFVGLVYLSGSFGPIPSPGGIRASTSFGPLPFD